MMRTLGGALLIHVNEIRTRRAKHVSMRVECARHSREFDDRRPAMKSDVEAPPGFAASCAAAEAASKDARRLIDVPQSHNGC